MTEEKINVVRGDGLFDKYLAARRRHIAYKKLQPIRHRDKVLDIGCGNYPRFLKDIDFTEKFGIEQNVNNKALEFAEKHGIRLIEHNIEEETPLPFKSDFFDAVTMLAVFEHIHPQLIVYLLSEIKRVLKSGGVFVLTTPAFWTDKLLRTLASIKLISAEEINDHKGTYSRSDVRGYLQKAGFNKSMINAGFFELFMNMWVTAEK
ncbi:MAG: class I SAM-dependent methyltransferase [Sedimentisphaerales bacterium]|nr:class I SAM-dependent methyltransferase [Sedimentisphaerales bacterium]